jgi:hypothetical protein
LILINDTSEAWSETLKVWLVSESGELLESNSREVTLGSRSQAAFDLNELFGSSDIYATICKMAWPVRSAAAQVRWAMPLPKSVVMPPNGR